MEAPWLRFYESGVPQRLQIPDLVVPDLLDEAARQSPDRIALRFFVHPKLPSGTTTYRELSDATLRFAAALQGLGIQKGARIAIMLPNCPHFVVAFYGALRAGAVVVHTNPLYVSREMKEQFEDAGAEAVVLLSDFLPRLRDIEGDTPIRRAIVVDLASRLPWAARLALRFVRLLEGRRGARAPSTERIELFPFERLVGTPRSAASRVEIAPRDLALLQYTGGTTGTPKAAMLSHRNLVANTLQVASWFVQAEQGRETVLAAIPFFHVYGMTTCLLFGVHKAAEIVMLPRPRPVDHVLAVLSRCRVTVFPGVPTLYNAIAHHPRARSFDLGSVRFSISGAAPLPREVAQSFEALTGGRLVEGYGLTEASPVTHCNPLFGVRKEGSIGLPLPETEARIVDPETREPLEAGREGELAVRGPQVMAGYWRRPEETARAIRDGWLFTGDIGRMDEDGYFYIVDRMKDMINASGFKVLPREVEEVLYLHPKVREAAVVGVPDPYRGETVKAFVVLEEGQVATEDELRDFCRQHLAPFKVPTRIEFRGELPKSPVGKILRRVLVEEEKARLAPRGGGS
jgi:long-chain acyl-CoA synthetase